MGAKDAFGKTGASQCTYKTACSGRLPTSGSLTRSRDPSSQKEPFTIVQISEQESFSCRSPLWFEELKLKSTLCLWVWLDLECVLSSQLLVSHLLTEGEWREALTHVTDSVTVSVSHSVTVRTYWGVRLSHWQWLSGWVRLRQTLSRALTQSLSDSVTSLVSTHSHSECDWLRVTLTVTLRLTQSLLNTNHWHSDSLSQSLLTHSLTSQSVTLTVIDSKPNDWLRVSEWFTLTFGKITLNTLSEWVSSILWSGWLPVPASSRSAHSTVTLKIKVS